MRKMFFSLLIILSAFSFSTYVSAAVDTTPPEIKSVKILTPEVKPGRIIKIEVDVIDDLSGIKEIQGIFSSPNNLHTVKGKTTIIEGQTNSGKIIVEFDLKSQNIEQGNWFLSGLLVQDNVGNYQGTTYSWNIAIYEKPIYFVYVHDDALDEPPVNDGFKEMESKTNVELDKEWTITFNLDIDIKTLLSKNIYVTDSIGQKVPLIFMIDRENNNTTSKIIIAPVDSYKSKIDYTLYIKDIVDKNGGVLKENVKMKFTTK